MATSYEFVTKDRIESLARRLWPNPANQIEFFSKDSGTDGANSTWVCTSIRLVHPGDTRGTENRILYVNLQESGPSAAEAFHRLACRLDDWRCREMERRLRVWDKPKRDERQDRVQELMAQVPRLMIPAVRGTRVMQVARRSSGGRHPPFLARLMERRNAISRTVEDLGNEL